MCSYIYSRGFDNNWKQKDFFEFAEFLQKKTIDIEKNNLVKLKVTKSKKLKLGFLSGDVRSNHSVTYFLKTVLLNYDRENFQIYLYFIVYLKINFRN